MTNTFSSRRLENVIKVYSYTRLAQLSTTFCSSKFPFLKNSRSVMDYVSKMSFHLENINLIGKYYKCLFFYSSSTAQHNFRFFEISIFENYMFKQISKSTKMYLFSKRCVWEKIVEEEIYCSCLAQLSTTFFFKKTKGLCW